MNTNLAIEIVEMPIEQKRKMLHDWINNQDEYGINEIVAERFREGLLVFSGNDTKITLDRVKQVLKEEYGWALTEQKDTPISVIDAVIQDVLLIVDSELRELPTHSRGDELVLRSVL